MAAFIYFTEEQIHRANETSLESYLRSKGESLIRSGREWRWKSHTSVTLQGNRWFRHSTGKGGLAIDFLKEFYDMEFAEAVTELLSGEPAAGEPMESRKEKEREKKPFELPEVNPTMKRVYAYLTMKRYLDGKVIRFFADRKLIYEDKKYHNAVFVGCDSQGVPRHAHRRGTYSDGISFKGNAESSDPRYSFHHIGERTILYVFEAPIDLLSYITLHQENWKQQSYVALMGVSDYAMMQILSEHPRIRSIRLCLDHDKAGIQTCFKFQEQLKQAGYQDIKIIQPKQKDWNEDIRAERGEAAIPASEHPDLVCCGGICRPLEHSEQDLQQQITTTIQKEEEPRCIQSLC